MDPNYVAARQTTDEKERQRTRANVNRESGGKATTYRSRDVKYRRETSDTGVRLFPLDSVGRLVVVPRWLLELRKCSYRKEDFPNTVRQIFRVERA